MFYENIYENDQKPVIFVIFGVGVSNGNGV